jgi:hypothetical protein
LAATTADRAAGGRAAGRPIDPDRANFCRALFKTRAQVKHCAIKPRRNREERGTVLSRFEQRSRSMQIRRGRLIAAAFAMSAVLTFSACILPFESTSAALASTARSTHTVKVTNADNGHSIRVHLNDRLVLTLTGPNIYKWSMPTASNHAVLNRTSGEAGSTATATFVAVKKGASSVTAAGSPNCHPACLIPSRIFNIAVTVVH